MAHELSGTFQQAIRIIDFCAIEESDIDVSGEGVDITERKIVSACRGMAIMQNLPNIVSATAHDLEPLK